MPRTYREALGVSVAVVRRSGALRFKAACGPASAGKDPRSRIRHAAEKFDKHFREAHRLLKASKKKGDVFWIHSVQRLTFPEVQHTGLGYGAMTRSGCAVGPVLARGSRAASPDEAATSDSMVSRHRDQVLQLGIAVDGSTGHDPEVRHRLIFASPVGVPA